MVKTFNLTFAGDTSLGDWYLRRPGREKQLERLKKDPVSFFKGINPLLKSSDHVILNLETVLAENPTGLLEGKQYPNWDSPDRTLNILKKIGVNSVSLANNHTMDFGPDIMLDTKKKLKSAGINTFGAGKNLKEAKAPLKITLQGSSDVRNVYVLNGMRASRRYREEFGFFAKKSKPGVNSANIRRMTQQISDIRSDDPESFIIICPHWQGFDYKWVSSKLEDRCRNFLEAGADFVFAHGTHMANHMEKTSKGIIVYSIGNFVFNSPGRYKKMDAPPFSLITELQITENNRKWQAEPLFYPIVTDNKRTDFQVKPADRLEAEELAAILNSKNYGCQLEIDEKKNHTVFKLNNSGLNQTEKTKYNQNSFTLKDFFTTNKPFPKFDYSNEQTFCDHIFMLENIHQEFDSKFFSYYEQLKNNPDVINDNEKLAKLSKVVKKNHMSHAFLKKFERKKLFLEKTMSFKEIIVEKSQLRRLGHKEYAWELDRKTKAFKFADAINLRRPDTDFKIRKFADIDEPTKPLAIKPVHSTGSRGVYLVFNNEKILSCRKGVYLTNWNEVVKEVHTNMNHPNDTMLQKDEWIVEELVLSAPGSTVPPSDLKFFCFYGKVVFVLESNRSRPNLYSFWDADMNPVKTGWDDINVYTGDGFSQEDLQTVKKASEQIPTPFMRWDMLKGHDGIVFGEATPRPGQFHLFNDDFDRMLGKEYRMAEARITKDLLNGKSFDAFTSIFEP